MAVGESATYRADVSNLPAAVRSDLDYQWYRGASKSELKPVDGATEQKFTIDSVSPEDDGTFINLVATADGAAHLSAPAVFAVQPEPLDPGFRACLDERFPNGYDTDDLDSLRSLDCSGRGIDDLNDLPTIDGDGNLSIDLSDNLIAEIPSEAEALVSDDGVMRTKQLNLSDNQITEVTGLADGNIDLSDSPANLIVLDGNRISNVSSFGSIGTPDDLDPPPISVRRQVVDRPGGPVGADVPVDVSDALNVEGDPLDLTLDGKEFGGTVSAAMRTVKSLTWDEDSDQGVAFSGTFLVPIGAAPSLGLAFPTVNHVGGDTVSVRGIGFTPGREITLRATSDQALFGSKPELKVTADGAGDVRTTFTIGNVTGTFIVEARSGMELLATAEQFEVDGDDLVTIPDDGLRGCIAAEVKEDPYGKGFYPSQLDRITTDFSCRNTGVKDLTGLGAVPSPSIDLSGNDVSSLETLKPLEDETTALSLANNELTKVDEIDDQLSLETLDLSENRLTDLSELEGVTFAENSEIIATGQTIRLPQRVVGQSSTIPTVVGISDGTTNLDFPDDRGGVSDGGQSFTWGAAGNQRIDFDLEESGGESSDPPVPGLRLAGSFLIRVVSAPPVAQPPSNPPAQQVPVSAPVPSLAPAPLADRIERENENEDEDEDESEAPRAVALGPEVALEEAAPAPRTVTNPTVEKRDPITSQAGWGLTATGWSLLGAALLAMALAVGIAVLTLGRSTR